MYMSEWLKEDQEKVLNNLLAVVERGFRILKADRDRSILLGKMINVAEILGLEKLFADGLVKIITTLKFDTQPISVLPETSNEFLKCHWAMIHKTITDSEK